MIFVKGGLKEHRKKVYFDRSKFLCNTFWPLGLLLLIPTIQLFYLSRISITQITSVFLVCLCLGLILSGSKLMSSLRDIRRWESMAYVEAEVIENLAYGWRVPKYHPNLRVLYQNGKIEFTAVKISRSVTFLKGSKIPIFFDPEKPQESFDLESSLFLSLKD